jgi:hypothetical protein
MSTKQSEIDDFFGNFPWRGRSFFQSGMNGNRPLAGQSVTIGEEYNSGKNGGHLLLFKKSFGAYQDHSKMIFFLDKTPDVTEQDSPTDIINNLKGLKVQAMLIGSSNQSKTTYYARKADKGEADVLILSLDEAREKDVIEMNRSVNAKLNENSEKSVRCVLSKEIKETNSASFDLDNVWAKYLNHISTKGSKLYNRFLKEFSCL